MSSLMAFEYLEANPNKTSWHVILYGPIVYVT